MRAPSSEKARVQLSRGTSGGYFCTSTYAVAILDQPRSYQYELRRGDEIIATGHLTHDRPLQVGDRITIGTRDGIIRSITPSSGQNQPRIIIQLLPHPPQP